MKTSSANRNREYTKIPSQGIEATRNLSRGKQEREKEICRKGICRLLIPGIMCHLQVRTSIIFLYLGPYWTPEGVQMPILIKTCLKHGPHTTPKQTKLHNFLFAIFQTYATLCISDPCRRHLAHPRTIRNQNL